MQDWCEIMNKNVVIIPNVSNEIRIGFAFNYMINIIKETELICDNIVYWDFYDVTFLHPSFIAPLAIYKDTSQKNIICINISLRLQSYLNSICFDRLLHFDNEKEKDVLDVMRNYTNKTYLPICSFTMTDSNKDLFGSVIGNIIVKQTNIKNGGITSLSYMVSELLDNIFEHSKSPNGYIFSQYLPSENVINLCIADIGISIYGSYKSKKLYQKEIAGNEAEALKFANDGYSTKNRPDAENRGYGIPTSKAMLVSGLNGAFFMLSGSAFHRYEKGVNIYVNLGKLFRWNGTVILMRIPTIVPDDFDYTKYIE